MKRRWAVLFWTSLAALAGVAWMARSFDISLASMMGLWLLGMIAACGVAFYAMVRDVRAKWPAAVVLACAGPMAIDLHEVLFHLPEVIGFLGMPGVVFVAGAVGTIAAAITVLVMRLPPPPAPPPLPPARVT